LRVSLNILSDRPYRAICGDLTNLPVKLQKFDLLLCLEVLEHLPKPVKILEQISQEYVGHCIFSVPNEPVYRLTRMILFRQDVRRFGNHPDHVNHWSSGSFQRLAAKYFRVERVVRPYPWTVVLCRAGT